MDKENVVSIYGRIYSAIKRRKFCYLQQHGWTLRALC